MKKEQRGESEKNQEPLFPVVGIGTSAGGVKALRAFFDYLSDNTGMAYVVIIHLSEDHPSNLDNVLQSCTEMKVHQVKNKTEIQPDHVYVIAPDEELFISGNDLLPAEKRKDDDATAVDHFFRSLAEAHADQAIGVILTGMGNDGTAGIKAIKEHGGTVLVQDTDDSEFDGMTASAEQTGLADFVLPLKDITSKFVEYKRVRSNLKGRLKPEALSEKEQEVLDDIFARLNLKAGHDFSNYKQSTVLRRIQHRMQLTQNLNLDDYLAYLKEHSDEATILFKNLLINVTNFFRDSQAFRALEEKVIPKLFESKNTDDELRIWVTGCATGEEAYSIAILLQEYASRLNNPPSIKIFATDISRDVLKIGRKGIYPETIRANVSQERLQRFFHKEGAKYRVKKEIRDTVLFSFHDLLASSPFSNLDLVACRNVIIYFNGDLQKEVFKLLHYVMRPEAFLFLGLSDSTIGTSELFMPADEKNGIFKSRHLPNSHSMPPDILLGKNRHYQKPALIEKPEKSDVQFDKLHYSLLARQYAPASVIISGNNEVIHSSAGINRYLYYGEGEPTSDLMKMVMPELRAPLRGILLKLKKKEELQPETRKTYLPEDKNIIQLTVQPVKELGFPEGFLQIIFKEIDDFEQSGQKEEKTGEERDAGGDGELINQLETELQETKEQLQVTVQEYQTSNEELRASNEELQTTTEELETSKEELQSMNEELRVINEEIESKVEELSKANNDLKNLMNATEIGIVFVDRDFIVRRFTQNIKGLFNLIESDLGRPLSHITSKLAYEDFIKDVENVLEDPSPIKKLVSSDNNRWYMMRLTPYRTIAEDIEGVVITFVEVTGLKEAEETLSYRAKQQEAIATLGLYTLNSFDPDLIMEKTTEMLTDVMEVEYIAVLELDEKDNTLLLRSGTGWDEGKSGHFKMEADRWETGYALETHESVIVENFQQEERFERSPLLSDHNLSSGISITVKGKEGAYGILGVYSKEQRSFGENEVNFLQTVANVLGEAIERVQTQRVLLEKNEQLKEAVKLRDTFFSIASHELQTPVTSMKIRSELFERQLQDADDPRYIEQVGKINSQIKHLSKLTSKLLDVSRIQRGKLTLEKEFFSLDELIEETQEALNHVSQHDIEVQGKTETKICVDRNRIGQVLTNLIGNAIKYSPHAGRVIVRYGQKNSEVKVSIVDFGIGISEEDQQRIFERFFKGGEGDKDTYPGFGIGLYISSQIIERHGGEIWMEDNPEGGLIFSFSLPVSDPRNN